MPIQFTCNQCGSAVAVPDGAAGQSVACPNCGAAVAAPGPPGQPPQAEGVPGPHGQAPHTEAVPPGTLQRKKNTGLIIALVVVACIVPLFCCSGFGIALMLPAVQAAREAARRAQCINNMKQVGLALHNYHDAYRSFPPAYIPDEDGRPMHSWRVLLLPYLEQQFLYDQYRFDEPWDSPHNRALADLMPGVYRCPSSPVAGETITTYAMAVGPDAFSPGPDGRAAEDFPDGLSQTIAVVEMAHAEIHWMEPRDWDTTGPEQPGSYHPGVYNVLYGDGRVQSVDTWGDDWGR